MINLDDIATENMKEHNANWTEVLVHIHGLLTIGSFGPAKINALLNPISNQIDIEKSIFTLRIHMKQNTNC